MHWAAKDIGLPYQAGGRGPSHFDCWGLVWLIYGQVFGIQLPQMPGVGLGVSGTPTCVALFGSHIEQDWTRINKPFDGCGVAMSQKKDCIHHAGVYVHSSDGGKVVHSWDGTPAVADTLRGLKLKGFRTVLFYRHALWPS